MPISNVSIIQSHGPGILEIDPGVRVDSPHAWGEFLSDIQVSDVEGTSYDVIPETFEKHRSARNP